MQDECVCDITFKGWKYENYDGYFYPEHTGYWAQYHVDCGFLAKKECKRQALLFFKRGKGKKQTVRFKPVKSK